MGCFKEIKRVIHGAMGQTKYAFGLDMADSSTIDSRRLVCRACDLAESCLDRADRKCRCGHPTCGCQLVMKTALAFGRCPLDKW